MAQQEPYLFEEIITFFPTKPLIKKIGSYSIGFLQLTYNLKDFDQQITNVLFDSENLLAFLLNKQFEVFKILELDEFIEENDDSIILNDEYFDWDIQNKCLEIMYKLPKFKMRIVNSSRLEYNQPKLQLRKASCQLNNNIVKNIIWDQFISSNYKKYVKRDLSIKRQAIIIDDDITKEDEEQFKILKAKVKEEQNVPKQLTQNEITKIAAGLFYFGFNSYQEANQHGLLFDFKKKQFVRIYRNDLNLEKFTPKSWQEFQHMQKAKNDLDQLVQLEKKRKKTQKKKRKKTPYYSQEEKSYYDHKNLGMRVSKYIKFLQKKKQLSKQKGSTKQTDYSDDDAKYFQNPTKRSKGKKKSNLMDVEYF